MERQYRIVRPDATDEEVKEAIESEGETSLFAQSVLQSAQASEAKRALKEVRERHMDIQNIVKSIEELSSLYQEMQYMVESQDVLVDNIDKTVEATNVQLEEVNVELVQATEIAKRSRKKKWILAAIGTAILAILLIVIVTTIMNNTPKK
ncbi:hypothetical protein DSO57_1038032 [Entomophthora muscae]|uniref:Uncharacterized protein n=1 Tax=Entomophthora muscae TaxID=34485 RepID=A0ACC2SBU1_9FUNG|nr:hypothetical protein DSO57_1038032 [Entomophthora muscae]